MLETALGEATETVQGMPTFGRADLPRVVKRAHQDVTVDWETFGIYRDDASTGWMKSIFSRNSSPSCRPVCGTQPGPMTPANLAKQLNYGELISSLNIARRTLAMSVTVGTAVNTEDARKRGVERQRNVVASRVADDLARSRYVESGLMQQWLGWAAMPPWSVQVIDALREVVSALNHVAADVARSLEAAATDAVEHPAPYPSLRLALSGLPLEEAHSAIVKAGISLGGDTSIGNVVVDRGSALRRLLWLKHQVMQPQFNHTFNVVGSFGSGTSRFLTRIAQAVDGSNDLALFMTVGPGESFTSMLLRRLSETFGMDFRDIATPTSC